MSRLQVAWRPGAIADPRAANDWYHQRDAKAAAGFETEVVGAVDAVEEAPDRWPMWHHGTRRYLLRRFPFFLVYKIHDSSVWIVAVAHAKRRPNYWQVRSLLLGFPDPESWGVRDEVAPRAIPRLLRFHDLRHCADVGITGTPPQRFL